MKKGNSNKILRLTISTFLVSGLVFVCTIVSFAAADYPDWSATSDAGSKAKWKTSPKVYYKIMDDTYETEAKQAIDNVSSMLSSVSSLSLKKQSGNKLPEDVASGEIVIYASNYGNTGWTGLTQRWRQSTEIKYAWSKINKYNRANAGTTGNGIQSTMAHELCHALGCGHTSSATRNYTSIMYPSAAKYTKEKTYKVDAGTKARFKEVY
jgi:hypothetical protein